MAALNVYLNGVNATTTGLTTTARTLLTTTTGLTANAPTTKTAKATGWDKISPQGSTATWASGASLSAPTGEGWILESTLLEGQTMTAGAWSGTIRLTCSSGLTGTVAVRIFKRSSAGVYTLIADARSTSTVFAATAVDVAVSTATTGGSAGVATDFVTGDRLYIGVNLNITVASGSATNTVAVSQGSGATATLTTPGYTQTPILYTRTGTDNISGLTDSADRVLIGVPARGGAETVPTLNDSATRSQVLTRTGADTAPADDDNTTALALKRSGSDSTTTSDTNTSSVASPIFSLDLYESGTLIRRLANDVRVGSDGIFSYTFDAAELTAISGAGVELRLSSTSVDVGAIEWDALTAIRVGGLLNLRTTSDAAAATDAVTDVQFFARVPLDNAPADDAALRGSSVFARTASDSTPAVDAASRRDVAVRTATDTVPASDGVIRSAVPFKRTGSDSTTTTDSSTGHAIYQVRLGSDTAPANDAGTRFGNRFRTAADTISVPTDAAGRSGSIYFRTAADTTTTTDAATRFSSRFRTTSDSTPTTDAASRASGVFARPTTDTSTTTDAAVRSPLLKRTAGDSTTTTDSAVRSSGIFARASADTTTTTDSAIRLALPFFRSAADSTTTSDATDRAGLVLRSATDLVTPSDATSRSSGVFARTPDDTVSVTDVAARLIASFRTAGDLAASVNLDVAPGSLVQPLVHPVFRSIEGGFIGDACSWNYVTGRFASDSTTTTDACSRAVVNFRSVSDSTTTSDGVQVTPRLIIRTTADSTTTTDSALRYSFRARSASDSLSTTDAATRSQVLARIPADSAPATDTGIRFGSRYRTASDTVTPTDAATRLGTFLRTPVDTTSAADSATRYSSLPRTATDTAPATDATARGVVFTRTAADSITTTDSATRVAADYRTGYDNAGPVEPVQGGSLVAPIISPVFSSSGGTTVTDWADRLVITGVHVASDSASAADSVVRKTSYVRQVTETTSVVDVASEGGYPFRVATDSLSTSDAVTRLQSLFRSLADSGPATDAATQKRILPRTASDTTATTTDAATRQPIFRRTASDSAPANDASTRSGSRYRTAADVVTPTDAATRTTIYARSTVETASATDSATRYASRARSTTESTSTSDATARLLFAPRAVSEDTTQPIVPPASLVQPVVQPLSSSGSATRPYDVAEGSNSAGRALNDSAPAVDSTSSPTLHLRTATDAVSAADSVSRPTIYFRGVRDQANYVPSSSTGLVQPLVHTILPYNQGDANDDAARWVANYRRLADDALTVGDVATRNVLRGRTTADSAPATQTQTSLTTHPRSVSDSAPATDQYVRQTFFFRALTETVTPTDSVLRALTLWRRTATDSIALADNASAVPPGRANDSAPAVDSAARSAGIFRRSTTDTVTPSDAAAQKGTRTRTTADSASATDSAVRAVVLRRTAADSTTASDAATSPRSIQRTSSEVTATTDAAIRTSSYLRTPTDVVSVFDSASRQGSFSRSTSDAVLGQDTLVSTALLFAFCFHSLPAPLDSAGRAVQAYRQAADAVTPADSPLSVPTLARSATDAIPTADSVQRQVFFVRVNPRSASYITDYYDPPIDKGFRTLALYRSAGDLAPINDQGVPLGAIHVRRAGDILPGVIDTLVAHVLAKRVGTDNAPARDFQVIRFLAATRTAQDASTTSDSLVRSRFRNIFLSDSVAAPTDSGSRAFSGVRRGSDGASVTDSLSRLLQAQRTADDLLGTNDFPSGTHTHLRALYDLLPTPVDVGLRQASKNRTARDRVLTPVETAWWMQDHWVGFGPPVATLTSISKTKVGNEPGCDTVDITFEFDVPVSAWVVRINSTGPYDGNLADTWEAANPGFGHQRFGTSPFGRVDPVVYTSEGTATIYAADLLHGPNEVVVYGRSLDGVWSFRPAPDPVLADATP